MRVLMATMHGPPSATHMCRRAHPAAAAQVAIVGPMVVLHTPSAAPQICTTETAREGRHSTKPPPSSMPPSTGAMPRNRSAAYQPRRLAIIAPFEKPIAKRSSSATWPT